LSLPWDEYYFGIEKLVISQDGRFALTDFYQKNIACLWNFEDHSVKLIYVFYPYSNLERVMNL